MGQFLWKPQFEIGIDQIDQQHKHLLGLLNKCLSSLANVESLFFELKQYSENHFSNEELLMQKLVYPEFAAHKKEHQFYEHRVQVLEESVLRRETKSIALMVDFLQDWFLDHILQKDRQFADYLRSTMSESEIVKLCVEKLE